MIANPGALGQSGEPFEAGGIKPGQDNAAGGWVMASSLTNSRAAEVLLVEDNLYDVILLREGFSRAKFLVNLHHVENGADCLAFLRKKGRYAEVPTPDFILLDINLPLVDGREVMREVMADDSLRHLPVVALTTSENDASVEEMRQLGCPFHMVKPVDFGQLQRVVRGIAACWFTLVIMPPSG